MPSEPIIQFDHAHHEILAHDLAQPVCMVIPGQTRIGQPVFMGKVMGGLTKLEAGALQIAAGAIVSQIGVQKTSEELADMACQLAYDVLGECAIRQRHQEAMVAEIAAQRAAEAAQRNGGHDVGRGRILTP